MTHFIYHFINSLYGCTPHQSETLFETMISTSIYTLMMLSYTSTSSVSQLHFAKLKLEACVTGIARWMGQNGLKMNGDKTEVLLLSSSYRPRPPIDSLQISGYNILFSTKASNIGVIVDEDIFLEHHETAICKSYFFHLRNICKIRKHQR